MYGPWDKLPSFAIFEFFNLANSVQDIAQNGFHILSHSYPFFLHPLERLQGQKIIETGTYKKKEQTVLPMIPMIVDEKKALLNTDCSMRFI